MSVEHFSLAGQVALVTGGSKGLGYAMAEAFADAGAGLVLASRNGAESRAAAARIGEATGMPAIGAACDVRAEDDVDALVALALEHFGRIDVLVNSAGMAVRGAIEEVLRADFEDCLATNVTGTWLACRAVARPMKAAGYGRVINLASALGLVGAAERTAYAASKGAVVQLTRSLALEWARTGITVNALAPGLFLTDANRAVQHTPGVQSFLEREVPARAWGELDAIRASALYLASPSAAYTTGSVLTVDGGWTAH